MTAADDDCVVQGDPSAGYRGSVLEMLRTRKWVGLTVLLVVMIVAFGALSFWQWERAQRDRIEAALSSQFRFIEVMIHVEPLDVDPCATKPTKAAE